VLEERTLRESQEAREREEVPFRVVRSDGTAIDLTYSSPRPAEEHDERALLETLPWFEPGKPLRNWMLHETDFYDEVEQIWGRRWGAEGIGTLREVLVSRPTETRPGGSTRRSGSTTTRRRAGTPTSGACATSTTGTTRRCANTASA
jgi:hypothetical protein